MTVSHKQRFHKKLTLRILVHMDFCCFITVRFKIIWSLQWLSKQPCMCSNNPFLLNLTRFPILSVQSAKTGKLDMGAVNAFFYEVSAKILRLRSALPLTSDVPTLRRTGDVSTDVRCSP